MTEFSKASNTLEARVENIKKFINGHYFSEVGGKA